MFEQIEIVLINVVEISSVALKMTLIKRRQCIFNNSLLILLGKWYGLLFGKNKSSSFSDLFKKFGWNWLRSSGGYENMNSLWRRWRSIETLIVKANLSFHKHPMSPGRLLHPSWIQALIPSTSWHFKHGIRMM